MEKMAYTLSKYNRAKENNFKEIRGRNETIGNEILAKRFEGAAKPNAIEEKKFLVEAIRITM